MFHTPEAPEAVYTATLVARPRNGRAQRCRPQASTGSCSAFGDVTASFARQLPNLLGLSGPNAKSARRPARWSGGKGEGGHGQRNRRHHQLASGMPAPQARRSSCRSSLHLIARSQLSPRRPKAGPPWPKRPSPACKAALWHRSRARTCDHGSIVIAAITSCTNTSNPYVMMAAGLLAKKAVETPVCAHHRGSKHRLPLAARVVTDYYTSNPVCCRTSMPTSLPGRRLRLHHLHRQLRPAADRRQSGH